VIRTQLRRSGLVVLIAFALAAASSAAGAPSPTVISTLDGKSVLPIRTRRIAHPGVASSGVAEVDLRTPPPAFQESRPFDSRNPRSRTACAYTSTHGNDRTAEKSGAREH
jgi:hypothetical protein